MTNAIAIRDLSLTGDGINVAKNSPAYPVQRLYVRRTVATYSCVECGCEFKQTAPGRNRPDPGLCEECEQQIIVTYLKGVAHVYRVRSRHPETAEVIYL